MHKYVSPTGSPIVGVAETVFLTTSIEGIHENGVPAYDGDGSTIQWDTAAPRTSENGAILFEDENGETWTFDQLKRAE